MNILIFAGGSGTRLWPASTSSNPKQLLNLIGDRTLLQNTYQRSIKLVDPKNIYIATLKKYQSQIKKQVPQISDSRFSLEPELKDRGPAIGLAALIMHHKNPESFFITMWSDHHITEQKNYFKNLIQSAENFLTHNPEATLTIGVKPAFAQTGFGYIQKSKTIPNNFNLNIYKVKSFKEKPDSKTAQKFLKSKNYLWNSGYFIWKTSTLLNLYQIYLPEVYSVLTKIQPFIGTSKQDRAINKYYKLCPKVEIENGLIEKLDKNLFVIEADFNWTDIGSWEVLHQVQNSKQKNVTKGLTQDLNSENILVYNYSDKQLVTTLGLKNIAVINTPSAILIADLKSSQDLKKLIALIKKNNNLKKYL